MLNRMKVIAFIAASGTGSRMNIKMPKQFVSINDTPLFVYPMLKVQQNKCIDEIVTSVPDGWHKYVESVSAFFGITKLKYIVTGGSSLPQSMRNMLEVVNGCNDQYVVVMMDGDRIIRDDVIDSALDNYEKFGTTIPYFNPYEAAFYMVDGENTALENNELDRRKIFLVAPPIIYPSEVVNSAMQYAMEHGLEDAYLHQLVIKLGYKVSFVKCSPYNIKVTEPGDFEVVKALLHQS